MNPITGMKGSTVSSEVIKNMWIELTKMQKENSTQKSKLQKTKQEYYVQSIADFIDDLKEDLNRNQVIQKKKIMLGDVNAIMEQKNSALKIKKLQSL